MGWNPPQYNLRTDTARRGKPRSVTPIMWPPSPARWAWLKLHDLARPPVSKLARELLLSRDT